MKLEDTIYQVFDRWKIELIPHIELLWDNKQIIRLRENFFNKIKEILTKWWELNLYNSYNPINIDLLRSYKSNSKENNWAMLCKIIESNSLWPILEHWSLTKVEVLKMFNINFEDIEEWDLIKSICNFWNDISVGKLIEWLSNEFYTWRMSEKEILEAKKLFFRQIILPN